MISKEERSAWRNRSINQFCAEDIFRLLNTLEKTESRLERANALIAQSVKIAQEAGEGAARAEAERNVLRDTLALRSAPMWME